MVEIISSKYRVVSKPAIIESPSNKIKKPVEKRSLEVFCKKRCSKKFRKIQMLQAYNFIKKETLAQVFSCEFFEISKNNFFTEHLRATASASLH